MSTSAFAFPKKKWLTSKELSALVKEKPAKVSKKEKTDLLSKCLVLWSKLVRTRDGHRCQKCGSLKNDQAHHIVVKSACSVIGMLNLKNGMTLCNNCHIIWIKDFPDEYILVRDSWLRVHGLTYDQLESECKGNSKVSVEELKEIKSDFEKRLKQSQNTGQ